MHVSTVAARLLSRGATTGETPSQFNKLGIRWLPCLRRYNFSSFCFLRGTRVETALNLSVEAGTCRELLPHASPRLLPKRFSPKLRNLRRRHGIGYRNQALPRQALIESYCYEPTLLMKLACPSLQYMGPRKLRALLWTVGCHQGLIPLINACWGGRGRPKILPCL